MLRVAGPALPHPRRPGTVTQPPRQGGRLPQQPRALPDDDHLRPGPRVRFVLGTERAQASDEFPRVAAQVRVMRADEVPAPTPGLLGLAVSHPP